MNNVHRTRRLQFRTVVTGYLVLCRCASGFIYLQKAFTLTENRIKALIDAPNHGTYSDSMKYPLKTLGRRGLNIVKRPSVVNEDLLNQSLQSNDVPLSLAQFKSALPELTETQWAQTEKLAELLTEWNSKVNLISRKDIENILERHILPTVAMSAALKIPPGAEVMDVGTGGGLPGLPMAICYPEAKFVLLDARGKKIMVVKDMAERLGLRNVEARHGRVEEVKEKFDFILGRSVTALPRFIGWVSKNLKSNRESSCKDAGIFYIKGGDFSEEVAELGIRPQKTFSIQDILGGPFDSDKNILHFPSSSILSRKKQ